MLQLSRRHDALIRLVRAGHEGERGRMRTASIEIATDILRFARDRSRDPHLRPLLDLQRRTESMSKPRLRTRKKAA